MRGLVADLLDYSRVRTQPLRADQVDLRALIDGVLDDLQVAVLEAGATVEARSLPVVLGDALPLAAAVVISRSTTTTTIASTTCTSNTRTTS